MRAPAFSKAASPWNAPSPAPDWTRTSSPALARPAAASGVSATRRSPGTISLGTAIFMGSHSWAARIADEGSREKAPRLLVSGKLPRLAALDLDVGLLREAAREEARALLRLPE